MHLQCSECLGTGMASLTHDRCRQVWDLLSLSALASQNVSRSSFCFPYGTLSVVYFISKCFTPQLHLEFFCTIFILFLEMLRKTGSLNSLDGTLPSFFTFALCNRGERKSTSTGHDKRNINAWHGGSTHLRIHTPIPTQEWKNSLFFCTSVQIYLSPKGKCRQSQHIHRAKEHTPRHPWVWSVLTPQPRPLPPSQVTFLWPCWGSSPAPQPGRGHSTPPICSTHSSAPYCWYLLYWEKWKARWAARVTQSSLKWVVSA